MISRKSSGYIQRMICFLVLANMYDVTLAYPKMVDSYKLMPSSEWMKANKYDIPTYNSAEFLGVPTVKNSTVENTYDYTESAQVDLDGGRHPFYGLYTRGALTSNHKHSNKKRAHRIEDPCAGQSKHFIGVAPTVATISVTPGDLLENLGSEASKAKQITAAILRRYSDIGVNQVASDILHNHLVSFTLSDQRAVSGNILSIREMLTDAYRELSRAAIVLEKMAGDDNPLFARLLEDLKENGIYNILCGLKVVMEAQHVAFIPRQMSAQLPTLPSRAERFARDFVVVHRIGSLLNDVGSQFSTLALYL